MVTKATTIDNDTGEVLEGEALSPIDVSQSLAIGLTKAEIDQQIATARQYPRSLKVVIDKIHDLATLDEESAEECMYSVPRGGKTIEGPSARFAEIVAASYGNQRTAGRVVHVDRVEKFVEAEGVFHDLETNSARGFRVRRRISDSKGRLYNDDMIQQTGNAAASIAARNATLAGIPKPVWRGSYQAARKVIMGTIETLANRRAEALKAFQRFGVTAEQVFAMLDVKGEEDITLEKLLTLRSTFATLKNGEATVEEIFSPRNAGKAFEKVSNPLADDAPADQKATVQPKTNVVAPTDPQNAAQDGQKAPEGAANDKPGSETPAKNETHENGAQQAASGPTSDPNPQASASSKATSNDAAAPTAAKDTGAGKPDPTGAAATGTAAGSPSGPAATNTKLDPISMARARGADAKQHGMARKAIPPEYRVKERQAEADAWVAGWDGATK